MPGNIGGSAKTGYTFKAWNTQADGGGNSYAPGDTFPMRTIDVTLYVVWDLVISTAAGTG